MYDITKGQLWTIIIGGIFLWFASLILASEYDTETIGVIGLVLIPVLIVFYILGWRKFQKDKTKESSEEYQDINKDFSKIKEKVSKFIARAGVPIIIAVVIAWILVWVTAYFLDQYSPTTPPSTDYPSTNSYQTDTGYSSSYPSEILLPNIGTSTEEISFSSQTFTNLGTRIENSYTYNYWNSKTTDGKFIEVEFTIENEEKLTKSFDLDLSALIDSEGRQFPADKVFNCHNQEGQYTSSDTLSYVAFDLKPGIPCKFNALFEVARDFEDGVVGVRYRLR